MTNTHPAASLVDVRHASFRIADRNILHDVSFSVSPREIITVIGPNGAGKSTLIKLLAKLESPSNGSITHRKNLSVGYVPQKLNIDRSMPLSAERFMRLSDAKKQVVDESLSLVGALHLAKAQMHDLSGGEFQRVLLARAIARKPDLLLLDEPLQGVDLNGQIELYELIAKIRDKINCGVVLVSHDLHLVMAQTDQVICLNHHICCHGSPESVSQHPEYLSLFGAQSAKSIAVYTHHHDHHHGLDGHVEPCDAECKHD